MRLIEQIDRKIIERFSKVYVKGYLELVKSNVLSNASLLDSNYSKCSIR